MKNHKFYYYDEQKDDFANTKIKGKQTPPDYQYLPQRLSYRIFKPIVYYAVLFLLEVFWIFFRQVPIKNRKVLRNRKEKKKGYFVYSNHTLWVTDAISAPVSVFPRQCYTIAHPDAISIPGLFTLVRMLGALPVPSAVGAYRNFLSAVEKLYQKGCVIAIFPEAHIWPKYHEIREFSPVSFHYPVKLNAPCFVKTTVYKKKKNGKTRPVLYYDGPFYPDPELSPRQAREELCRRVYEQMRTRAEGEGSATDERYQYIRVPSADQVRTERQHR